MTMDTPPRRGARRGLWEALIVTVLLASCYGVWHLQEYRLGKRYGEEIETSAAEHLKIRGDLEAKLNAATAAEGAGVTRAFAVGIDTLAAEERWQEVDAAVLELLELPGVDFVHVLDTEGGVLVSSDRKLLATGQAGPEASWVLGAEGLVQQVRGSDGRGHDYSMPVAGGDAYLWLGYSLRPSQDPSP